ncbi:MAG: synthase subunit delta [Pseudonocardia sp.]|jgi:F-type H+-transporting ATPase subunit delta|uniref:F0F1 ATP synthase subunit delta n=1 Tax=Pseudonocardia sp. TaxID=60912 RepID=UPI002615FF47|nr:F0F1 ATP synthase subunit delta [Pseudonocardia sp.]MCU1628318.1 synthase subunit delta [Pseudonocardia sp.]MDT7703877.1 F-type H+-transporting ATPase subunit delta [Pseudonocardiales bacterium]
MALHLQATSRDSLAGVAERLEGRIAPLSAGERQQLGEQLYAVTRLLAAERTLRRALSDPATSSEQRKRLAESVLNGKISSVALETVGDLVSARWSGPADLVEAAESLARQALLAAAEKQRALDGVEDQLFRFGRILDREPELTSLLSDTDVPADKRVALLDEVLGDKVYPVTAALLRETVRTPRGRYLDVTAEELADLAAARRDRSVARVRTAVGLSDAQEQRLTGTLTRLYGRDMSLQVELDESLLGGMVIRVGDEVVDGSVAGKLAAARRALPH